MADSYFNIACKELKNVNKDVSKDSPISDGFSWYTVNIALLNFSVIVNGCRERPRTPHAILCFCTCFSIRFLVCYPYFRDFFPGIKGNSLTRVLVLNVPSFFTQVLVVYNFACSLISFYSVAVIVVALARNWPHSLFVCEEDELVKHALWVYYMTKYVELLDTVFMVLRHRQRQISLLHVSNIRCPPFCQAHGFLFQINRLLSTHIRRQNC